MNFQRGFSVLVLLSLFALLCFCLLISCSHDDLSTWAGDKLSLAVNVWVQTTGTARAILSPKRFFFSTYMLIHLQNISSFSQSTYLLYFIFQLHWAKSFSVKMKGHYSLFFHSAADGHASRFSSLYRAVLYDQSSDTAHGGDTLPSMGRAQFSVTGRQVVWVSAACPPG